VPELCIKRRRNDWGFGYCFALKKKTWVCKEGMEISKAQESLSLRHKRRYVTWVQRTHTDQTDRLTPMFFSYRLC
jgi:hypothetical protein